MAKPVNADRAAFDALVALLDPWRYGDEDTVRHKLAGLAPIDWPLVLAVAARHRVTPLLAARVKAAGLAQDARLAPPAACLAALDRQALAAQASELGSLAELRRLRALFDREQIPFLVFKGLTLSWLCFGRLGVRINRDIDILVAPEAMLQGHAALVAAGYCRVEPEGELAPEAVALSLERTKDWVYVKPGTASIVELHHRLFDNVHLCDPEVAARARRLTLFDQVEVATLAAEDEIAYLALHGAMHAWSRLKWLLDVAILIRDTPPADLDALLRRNRGGPAAGALHQAIALCWRLFTPPTAEPRTGRPWRAPLLTAAAMHTIAGHGAREIEDTGFGTTLKNLSHYLLWLRPGYLRAELRFDLTDMSRDDSEVPHGLPVWLYRPASWLLRRLRSS